MYSIADIIAGSNSAMSQPAVTVPTGQATSQGMTGKTNAGTSAAKSGTADSHLYVGAAIIGVSLVFLWVGGGIVFKGV